MEGDGELDKMLGSRSKPWINRFSAPFNWGLSLRAVPIPTSIASCIVRILSLKLLSNIYIFMCGLLHVPVRHYHAFFPTEDQLLSICSCDFRIKGLSESQGNIWSIMRMVWVG